MSPFPYAKIIVSGADAFEFLQAQLSNDLRRLEQEAPLLAAWCNPKGRVICIVSVSRNDAGYALVVPAELAESVMKRLTLFRFRAKVVFESVAATEADLGTTVPVEDWLLQNLRAGRPEIWQAQSESFTPHMLNLDRIGAISFDKGCYPGQEIVARTHYRGASKRRTHRFEASQAVAPGDRISNGERDVGEVLNAIGKELLAVIPDTEADATLSVDGVELRHISLEYA